jgi:hypothetical protein
MVFYYGGKILVRPWRVNDSEVVGIAAVIETH